MCEMAFLRLPAAASICASMLTSAPELLEPIDFALDGGPFPLPPQPFQARRTAVQPGRGTPAGPCWPAMLVTSWAFTVLRRCKSAEGKTLRRLVVQAPGHLEDLAPGQTLADPPRRASDSASSASAGVVDQAPDQAFFGVFQLPEGRAAPGR